jgi:hypothetical protein
MTVLTILYMVYGTTASYTGLWMVACGSLTSFIYCTENVPWAGGGGGDVNKIGLTSMIIFCYAEKPDTQTSIRLASHLVRAPNSRFGGHEFEYHVRLVLGALTKSRKTLGVRSFYSGDPAVITWSCQSVWLRNARKYLSSYQMIHIFFCTCFKKPAILLDMSSNPLCGKNSVH